jgi:hypothetical protein
MQEQRDGLVVDAGGFEHEAQLPGCRVGGVLCPGQQQRVPLRAVVDPLGAGQRLLWVAQPGAVQALFADVDADKLHKSCSLNNDNEVIFSTVLPCACRLPASGRASDTVQTRRRSGRWSGGTFFESDSGSQGDFVLTRSSARVANPHAGQDTRVTGADRSRSVATAMRTDGASRDGSGRRGRQKACSGTREFVNLLTGVS